RRIAQYVRRDKEKECFLFKALSREVINPTRTRQRTTREIPKVKSTARRSIPQKAITAQRITTSTNFREPKGLDTVGEITEKQTVPKILRSTMILLMIQIIQTKFGATGAAGGHKNKLANGKSKYATLNLNDADGLYLRVSFTRVGNCVQ
ncbi:MAG: hypothetical protein ACYC67_27635, partial [Prosthecobacter sp.]